jgi:hypothetical protein
MAKSDTDKKATDSWKAYQDCLGAIHRFLTEIRIEDGEAWVGEVCLGSPDHPLVKAPFRRDSADLVGHAIDCAETVAAKVIDSIRKAMDTSRRVVMELEADGDVDTTDFQRVIGRIESLERLLAELTGGARSGDMASHPAQLLRWSQILRDSLVPGDLNRTGNLGERVM